MKLPAWANRAIAVLRDRELPPIVPDPSPPAERSIVVRSIGWLSDATGVYLIDGDHVEQVREACRRATARVAVGPDWRLTEAEVEANCKAAIVRTFPPAKPDAVATLLDSGWCSVSLWLGSTAKIPGIAVELRRPAVAIAARGKR